MALTPEEATKKLFEIIAQVDESEIKKVYYGAAEGATMYFEFLEDYRTSRHSIFSHAEYLIVAVKKSDLPAIREIVNAGQK